MLQTRMILYNIGTKRTETKMNKMVLFLLKDKTV